MNVHFKRERERKSLKEYGTEAKGKVTGKGWRERVKNLLLN